MDLNSSNIGYRISDNSIIFFDFGSSVTIKDLKEKLNINDKEIEIYKQYELEILADIFKQSFPDEISLINETLQKFKKNIQQQSKRQIRQKIELLADDFVLFGSTVGTV
jgi:hypothetical protein